MRPGADREAWVRGIARHEVASLLGLILRRIQDREELAVDRDPSATDGTLARQEPIEFGDLASIIGEALQEFGGTVTGPGS